MTHYRTMAGRADRRGAYETPQRKNSHFLAAPSADPLDEDRAFAALRHIRGASSALAEMLDAAEAANGGVTSITMTGDGTLTLSLPSAKRVLARLCEQDTPTNINAGEQNA